MSDQINLLMRIKEWRLSKTAQIVALRSGVGNKRSYSEKDFMRSPCGQIVLIEYDDAASKGLVYAQEIYFEGRRYTNVTLCVATPAAAKPYFRVTPLRVRTLGQHLGYDETLRAHYLPPSYIFNALRPYQEPQSGWFYPHKLPANWALYVRKNSTMECANPRYL